MKFLLLAPLFMLLASLSHGEQSEFQFRSSDRPAYSESVTVEELKQGRATGQLLILDVRLEEDFAKQPALIPGAEYRNPETLPTWIATLDKTKEVVVYCVAGKWVSQKVASLLDEAGISVRSLEGGIEAWNESHQQ